MINSSLSLSKLVHRNIFLTDSNSVKNVNDDNNIIPRYLELCRYLPTRMWRWLLIFVFSGILFFTQYIGLLSLSFRNFDETNYQYSSIYNSTSMYSKVYINGHPLCTFLPEIEHNPLPVILMSRGRSGSSVTWNTLSRFVGEASIAYEYTGGNSTKSDIFLRNIPKYIGRHWASLHLCKLQNLKRNRFSGISGFQWKPFPTTMRHTYSVGALHELSSRNNPKIRIIYLTRNHIDRMISNMKHKGHKQKGDVQAHCSIGDYGCVMGHVQAAKNGIELPVQLLIHDLKEEQNNNFAERILRESGVHYIHIEYEKLFDNGNDASEWIRVFQFLGRGPMNNLTMNDVRENFSILSTSTPRNETVRNWFEVKTALLDHGFGYILASIGELD